MRLSGPMSQRWDERIQKRTPGVDTRWRGLSLGDKHLMHGTESPKKRTPPITHQPVAGVCGRADDR